MNKLKWIYCQFLLICILIPALAIGSDYKIYNDIVIIDPKVFKGFEECKLTNKLNTLKYKLHRDGKPKIKDNDVWSYDVESKIYELPITEIIIGVCEDGSLNCGWAGYMALVIPKYVEYVDETLKRKTGIEFKVEKREEEAGVSLRPILIRSERNNNESILFCDPGGL